MSRTIGYLLAACACLALDATATAQPPPDAPEPAVRVERAVPPPPPPGSEIDQWIFGIADAGTGRKRLQEALAQDINRFDQKYGLTPAQRKKLELAGGRDLKRFFDRVAEVKADYRRANNDWNTVSDRLVELQRISNQPHSELFGDDSMLAKTLRKNLAPEQVLRYEKSIYRKRVEWMAGLLHSRLVFADDQRRRLVDLVVEETPPLKRYGNFDYDAIMLQMSRLPRERLRTVLDEGQCHAMALRFDQARRMETILISEGYLSPSAPAPGALRSDHEEARR